MSKAVWRGMGTVAVVGLLVLLQGCGGDSGSTTKAEFTKEAKNICNKAEQEREEVASKLILEYQEREENATPKKQEESVLRLLKVYEKTTSALAELDVPEGEEQKVEALLKAREDAAAQVKASPATALHNGAPFKKPDDLAKSYDLESCSI